MGERSGRWSLTRHVIMPLVLLGSAHAAFARLPLAEPPNRSLSDETLNAFLRQGGWSQDADDDPSARHLDASFIKGIVDAYTANPSDSEAINELGLIGLALAVAEWGVEPADGLPTDPAGKKWRGVVGADGKRLMSYSKGAIGVSHADSDSLFDFFAFIKKTRGDSVPQAKRFYELKGINFDRLYADGGHCTKPTSVIGTDLDGKPFGYVEHGYAGDGYCADYANRDPNFKITREDWQLFRHNMRLILRDRQGQAYLINAWLSEYWWPSYKRVATMDNGTIEDVMVNSRIRNSSPVTANCALTKAKGSRNTVKTQLEAYAAKDCKGKSGHMRRWPYMMRAVKIYMFYANRR